MLVWFFKRPLHLAAFFLPRLKARQRPDLTVLAFMFSCGGGFFNALVSQFSSVHICGMDLPVCECSE